MQVSLHQFRHFRAPITIFGVGAVTGLHVYEVLAGSLTRSTTHDLACTARWTVRQPARLDRSVVSPSSGGARARSRLAYQPTGEVRPRGYGIRELGAGCEHLSCTRPLRESSRAARRVSASLCQCAQRRFGRGDADFSPPFHVAERMGRTRRRRAGASRICGRVAPECRLVSFSSRDEGPARGHPLSCLPDERFSRARTERCSGEGMAE